MEVAHITAFLGPFQQGHFATARSHYAKTGEYLPILEQLMDAIVRSELMYPFDWVKWPDRSTYLQEPKLIDNVDFLTLRKIITMCLRQDRFCGGFLAEICSSGVMERLLVRLETLRVGGKCSDEVRDTC